MAHRPAPRGGQLPGEVPRGLSCRARRRGGDGTGHRALGADGRADPGGARVDRTGRGGDSQRARPGSAGVRGDLPAVLLSHRGRPRSPGGGRDEVLLQPAAAGRSGPRGNVAGGRERHLPGRLLRPRSLSLRLVGQARARNGPGFQARRQRDPRHRGPAASPLQRGGSGRAGSTSSASSSSRPRTRPASTAWSTAREASRSGPTRTSRSGTRTSRSPSPSTCSTTTWTTPRTRGAG